MAHFVQAPVRLPLGKPCSANTRAEGQGITDMESHAYQFMPSLGMILGSAASAWLLMRFGRCAAHGPWPGPSGPSTLRAAPALSCPAWAPGWGG